MKLHARLDVTEDGKFDRFCLVTSPDTCGIPLRLERALVWAGRLFGSLRTSLDAQGIAIGPVDLKSAPQDLISLTRHQTDSTQKKVA